VDRQKLVIVVLVAIAVVFAITVGFGARDKGGGGGSDDKDPVEFLEGLRSEKFLQIEDGVTAQGCQDSSSDEVTVAAGVPCTIEVPSSGRFSRPTSIVMRAEPPVVVRVEPNRGPTLDDTVGDGDEGEDECVQTALSGAGRVVFTSASQQADVELDDDNCPEED
jgi:hypothetical protein